MSEPANISQAQMTGAQALVKTLEMLEVDTIFGYPGGANLPIYDALRNSKIQHILARHEQGAIHMAEGYARIMGKPGVCLATSGPGVTNLITGLADAYLDSIPLVVITGQIPRALIGTDAFQEVDCINITMPVTKHNELIFEEENVVPSLKAAFYIADSGRKGPVLLDFPKDVLSNKFPHHFDHEVKLRGYNPTVVGNIGQIKKALRLLAKAERPLILFGGGITIAKAEQEFLQFIRTTKIPVVRTLMGTGVIADNDPYYIGLIGTHGNSIANRVVQRDADVVMAIGTRLGNRSVIKSHLFAKNAKVIHIDIDPAEIGKSVTIDIPIVGDIKVTLQTMNERVSKRPLGHEEPWITNNYQERTTMLPTKDAASVMEDIFVELSKIDIPLHVSTDVGRHQMWANHHCTNPKHLPLLTSGGLGTMGFGLPAAIGAWFAGQDTPVVCLSGDGSFMMTLQEFSVAVEHKVPLTVIILNDFRLGMIRELQDAQYGSRHTVHDLHRCTNFPKLAEAMGGMGYSVKRREQIGPVLREALNNPLPTLIDFDMEKLLDSIHLSLNPIAS
ncbi:MAG: acetolactate synthase, large subunit, biosynthetic type [SAR324 cluster bacterium]|uniref:Acetolactate synthase n=1 Tax=SAR324 cluster bacterium TaxID=2024889 RepID=A0A2A4T6L2_9DELT|nr:MAG: acetolactate synthase, large subunit, biosynthetic type [SAR324 cluster bacterium]